MNGAERNLLNPMIARILAVILLFAIALAPVCGAVCHANSCDVFQTARQVAKQDSGCHHQPNLSGQHSAALSAQPTGCGVRDLIFALPAERRILASVAKNSSS